jgi:hypothetical protein
MASASSRRHPRTGRPLRRPAVPSLDEQALIDAKTAPTESICANHRRYAAMDRVLAHTSGAVASRWFAAAACVTHPRRGLGTLDGPLGRLAFQPAQAAFLRFVHLGLFANNLVWFDQLRRGATPRGFEGLRGRTLDHALVDAEQRKFSQLVQQYFHGDSPLIERFMRALNERFRQSLVLRSRLLPPALREALQRLRAESAIDMASEAQRRCIGHHLVDRIREARGAARD